MDMDNQLGGALGDYSDYGEVDAFGLDEFGNPAGMGAGWGALIGGGVSTVGAIVTRMMAKSAAVAKWSEGIGALAGVVAGGAMWFKQSWRHAGVAAMATSLVTGGLRQLEALFVAPSPGVIADMVTRTAKTITAPAPAPAPAAAAPGWGETVMHTTGIIPGGLGIATISPTGVVAPGGFGEAGPQLLGRGPAAQRTMAAQLVGVPGLNGGLASLAGAFGSTVMGG